MNLINLINSVESNTLIGVVGAIFGGIGVRIVDKMLSRRSDAFTEAEKIRSELRSEVDVLKEEISILQEDVVKWRELYWKVYEEAAQLRVEVKELLSRLQSQDANSFAGHITGSVQDSE